MPICKGYWPSSPAKKASGSSTSIRRFFSISQKREPDIAHETAVVADQQAGGALGQKFALQRLLSFNIQVVGGFVEQVEVGLLQAEEQHGEAGLLAARQGGEGFGLRVLS